VEGLRLYHPVATAVLTSTLVAPLRGVTGFRPLRGHTDRAPEAVRELGSPWRGLRGAAERCHEERVETTIDTHALNRGGGACAARWIPLSVAGRNGPC
jgi:hypothetical protein